LDPILLPDEIGSDAGHNLVNGSGPDRLVLQSSFRVDWEPENMASVYGQYRVAFYRYIGIPQQSQISRDDLLQKVEITLQFSAQRDRSIQPLSWFLQRFSTEEAGPVADFAHSFPNLNSEMKTDLQNRTLLLGDLERKLSDETRFGKRDFEIFGVKIGSDQIALFGLPALGLLLFNLGAIALYAAKHAERLEVKEASNWSFLLQGWQFSVLTYLVVAVLPFAAAVYTLIRVQDRTPKTSLLGTLVIGVSLFVVHGIHQLRRRVGSKDAEAIGARARSFNRRSSRRFL
jgi:hypothetical protein